MTKKSKSKAKAVAAPAGDEAKKSMVAQIQPNSSKTKAKKGKKAASTKQAQNAGTKSAPSAANTPATAQVPQPPASHKSAEQTKKIDMMEHPQQAVQKSSESSAAGRKENDVKESKIAQEKHSESSARAQIQKSSLTVIGGQHVTISAPGRCTRLELLLQY